MAQETGTPRQLVFRSCHKAQRLSRYRPRRSSLNAGTLARLSTLSRQLRSITVPFTSLEAAADSITMDLDGLWLWTGSRLYPFLYAVCYLLGLRLLTEETSIQLTKSELHAAHSLSAKRCNRAQPFCRPKQRHLGAAAAVLLRPVREEGSKRRPRALRELVPEDLLLSMTEALQRRRTANTPLSWRRLQTQSRFPPGVTAGQSRKGVTLALNCDSLRVC